MEVSAIGTPLNLAVASVRHRSSSSPLCYQRNLGLKPTVSALSSSYGDSSVLEAKKGNPPIMPAVMTPGGPLDLSTVLFRNRIIFIGQPVNSQVAQRVISQLVTLATFDEQSDILIYLNCPGGSTYSILAIYDCMSWGHVEDVWRQVSEAVQSRHASEFGLIDGVLETEY